MEGVKSCSVDQTGKTIQRGEKFQTNLHFLALWETFRKTFEQSHILFSLQQQLTAPQPVWVYSWQVGDPSTLPPQAQHRNKQGGREEKRIDFIRHI